MREPDGTQRKGRISCVARCIRIGAAICLIVVCLHTAQFSAKYVYNAIANASMAADVLLGAATALTWILLLTGSIGLLVKKRWAFWLIYVAAALNIVPGYFFVPFVGLIFRHVDPMVALIVLFYGGNTVFLTLLILAHVVTRPSRRGDAAR